MLTHFVNFLLKRVAPTLGYFLIVSVGRTMRLKVINSEWIMDAKARGKNVIFAFWHNRLVMMPYFYNYCVRGDNLAIMISRSKDGEIISDVCAKFGLRSVRGSTTRGGKAALRELIRILKDGSDAGYTPDGPRGPRYSLGQGIITLAQMTGYPIVTVSYEAAWKKTFRSWDRMIIPFPFTRAALVFGDPIEVSPDANENMRAEKAIALRRELFRAIEKGTEALGLPCEPLDGCTPGTDGARQ